MNSRGRRSTAAGALPLGSPFQPSRNANPGGAAPGRVVHVDDEPYDVYIGRPGAWGNPFKIGMDGTREEVIAKYEAHMRDRLAKQFNLRGRIAELQGKTLGCWCKPHACHGDVLLKLAAEINGGCSPSISNSPTKGA